MIVEIVGRIEIDLDNPSGKESVRLAILDAIDEAAEQWGDPTRFLDIKVTEEDRDPQPEEVE